MTPPPKPTRTRPGRPAAARHGGQDTRAGLLRAARAEFAQHGFRGTTIRRIAERAGVTPAMVHYHFRDKHGLYLAMLEETVNPLLGRLEQLAATDAADSLAEALLDYMHQLARTPELPTLLMRDVLAADGAMRDPFIRDVASRGAGALRAILAREAARGRLREDLDLRLALLSLISMAVFPFIARPVVGRVLGLDYDEAMIARLAAHTAQLFHSGADRADHGTSST